MDIRINNYTMYGLNHNRSFLKAPVCDCGCGKPADLVLKTKDDVIDFCMAALKEYDCNNAAIFAVFQDGEYMVVMSSDEKEGEYFVGISDDMHSFAETDGVCRFCCYNLITERKPGLWMIES